MSKLNLKSLASSVTSSMVKHSPEILTGLGIVGMLTTTVLAVKATPKAIKIVEEKKEEYGVDKLSAGEVIKATYKCYIPAASIALVSTGCLIGSSSINARRNAALATAYKIVETAHREYKEKVVETIGEKKEELIKDKIAKNKIDQNPASANKVIVVGKGETLCYDSLSGRYFKSDRNKIEKAINELNRTLTYDMYVSLNDLYRNLGLEGIKLGDDLGWKLDWGLIDVHFSSQLSEDDVPCLVLIFNKEPRYDYDKFC